MTVYTTPRGPIFKAGYSAQECASNTKRRRFRTALAEIFPTPPLLGLAPLSPWSFWALKIGPGGLISLHRCQRHLGYQKLDYDDVASAFRYAVDVWPAFAWLELEGEPQAAELCNNPRGRLPDPDWFVVRFACRILGSGGEHARGFASFLLLLLCTSHPEHCAITCLSFHPQRRLVQA